MSQQYLNKWYKHKSDNKYLRVININDYDSVLLKGYIFGRNQIVFFKTAFYIKYLFAQYESVNNQITQTLELLYE